MRREVQLSSADFWPGLNRSFANDVCWPFLRAMQNPDGGWGYTPRTQSCVEATCWALLAFGRSGAMQPYTIRGAAWLERAQMRNGAWPAHPADSRGGWSTALACLALRHLCCAADSVAAGVGWLCDFLPAEATFPRRAAVGIASRLGLALNNAAYGWSCHPGATSATEPTAAALLALESLPRHGRPRKAARRIEYARHFLRGVLLNACNPADCQSRTQPICDTAWALLALRDDCHHAEIQDRLDWLHRAAAAGRGPASVALAQIALRACGRRPEFLDSRLARQYSANRFLNQIPVMAMAAIALNPLPAWLVRQPFAGVMRGTLLQRA